MLLIILKSSGCLSIFMIFYKLFLENESIHTFKRYYLLASILVSIIIPFITFTQYVEPIQTLGSFQPPFINAILNPQEAIDQQKIDYLPIILWSIYSLGVLLFSVKFINNLLGIFNRIKRNTKHKSEFFTNVLLKDLIIPHTFFSYIFLNKQKFETQQIPEEVLIHEQTHAKQKHSIDVILIEILQILFWFNPLIYLLKYAIKLNHEFLADETVLKQGILTSNYQNTLLSFSSNDSEPQLAHAINYSSIKKRFTVMKTKTSKQKTWLLSIILLPVLAIMFYSFSNVKEIEKEVLPEILFKNKGNSNLQKSIEKVNSLTLYHNIDKDEYYKNATFKFRGNNKKIIAVKSYNELTETEKFQLINPPSVPLIKKPSSNSLNDWKNASKFGVWVDEKRITNNALGNYSSKNFSLYFVSKLDKNAKNYGKHYYQVNLLTNNYYNKKYNNGINPLSKNAIIYITKNIIKQKGASKSQIAEYNKLAKKYNTITNANFIVKNKEVKRLKYIYRIMSVEQRKNAEPFPVFPPPPPAPVSPKVLKIAPPPPPTSEDATLEQKKKYEKIINEYNQKNKKVKTGFIDVKGKKLYYTQIDNKVKYYNRFGVETDKNGNELQPGKQVNANDVLPNSTISKVYYNDKVVSEFKKTGSGLGNIPPPPPPPTPISPLDHVIDMAKKGATFYLEGKQISSDKAIKALKKNKHLNIQSKNSKVFITKRPILIGVMERKNN